MIGGDHTSCASHVLDQDRRGAGDVLAHVPANRAGIGVEAATGREADDDANSLAVEKFFLSKSR